MTMVSNFSWVLQSSQDKSKTMVMHCFLSLFFSFFFGGGGGGEVKKTTKSTEAHATNSAVWHAHSHIIPVVGAMDSCFVLVRTHQHGIASTVSLTITDPAFTVEASALWFM